MVVSLQDTLEQLTLSVTLGAMEIFGRFVFAPLFEVVTSSLRHGLSHASHSLMSKNASLVRGKRMAINLFADVVGEWWRRGEQLGVYIFFLDHGYCVVVFCLSWFDFCYCVHWVCLPGPHFCSVLFLPPPTAFSALFTVNAISIIYASLNNGDVGLSALNCFLQLLVEFAVGLVTMQLATFAQHTPIVEAWDGCFRASCACVMWYAAAYMSTFSSPITAAMCLTHTNVCSTA